VAVIDSDPLTRAGICALLRRENARVMDDMADLPTALSRLPGIRPDFAFVEARLASENAGAPIRAILRLIPGVKIIAFGRGLLEEEIFHVLEAGASGYLLHGAAERELLTAMRCAQEGRRYIPPEVELKLRRRQARRHLTPREGDVLELLGRARSNATIAVSLGISVETVKLHVKSILGKLGVEDRAEAAIIAIQRGLVRLM
jgi:NarL family two-component system response regulator LiaR